MIADHLWRTRCVIVDAGEVPKFVGGLTRGRTGLVVDKQLPEHRDALMAGDLKGLPVLELNAAPVTVGTLREVGSFIRENGLQTVAGLGGGSVLDAVKLAALFTADPRPDHLRRTSRQAFRPARPASHHKPQGPPENHSDAVHRGGDRRGSQRCSLPGHRRRPPPDCLAASGR